MLLVKLQPTFQQLSGLKKANPLIIIIIFHLLSDHITDASKMGNYSTHMSLKIYNILLLILILSWREWIRIKSYSLTFRSLEPSPIYIFHISLTLLVRAVELVRVSESGYFHYSLRVLPKDRSLIKTLSVHTGNKPQQKALKHCEADGSYLEAVHTRWVRHKALSSYSKTQVEVWDNRCQAIRGTLNESISIWPRTRWQKMNWCLNWMATWQNNILYDSY